METNSAHGYTDKHDATFIKVKEGKLWASDCKKLEDYNLRLLKKDKNYGDYKFFSGKSDAEIKLEYDKDLEAFNQSFKEVGNWEEFVEGNLAILPRGAYKKHSGLYPVSGLQFEVREQYYHEYDDEWYDSGGLQFSKTRKVAILSIKTQSKCCKLNPNGCEDCTEFDKLNTPQAVAILSLKQEQPSEEKEGEEIKCTACDGKGWLPHTPSPVEGEKEEPNDKIINFLLGHGDYNGVWFGESSTYPERNFWWRTPLRQFVEAQASRIKALEERLEAAEQDVKYFKDFSKREY